LKAHVAVEGVIGDVGDEEKGGKDKRREHRRPVLADAPDADEAETDDQGHGRKGVEKSVERRKEKQVGACDIGGGVIIDEPAEEEAGDGADGDNGGNDAERGTVLLGRECPHSGKAKIVYYGLTSLRAGKLLNWKAKHYRKLRLTDAGNISSPQKSRKS
jgi:hypothetical protein